MELGRAKFGFQICIPGVGNIADDGLSEASAATRAVELAARLRILEVLATPGEAGRTVGARDQIERVFHCHSSAAS